MKADKRITVLMYHRIDTVDTDPWRICVAPQVFEEQIQYLTSHYPVITVPEAVQCKVAEDIPEHSICITFDDGYADNYLQAKMILEKYKCPATFFIPTAFIGASKPFWWDELEYIFLHVRKLPRQLALPINGQACNYTLNDSTLNNCQWQQHLNWRWYEAPPTDRCFIFLSVWESLRSLPQQAIQNYLANLREWAGSEAPAGFRSPINSRQIQDHFRNPLFTAGLHTHTHPDLGTMTKPSQIEEIEMCRNLLQNEYGLDSLYLAYPYGSYNKATLAAVEALGLAACFTTESESICVGSNVSSLGRYQACNWNLEEFKNKLLR